MVSEIITNIFGDLTPLAAMIILVLGALIMPAVQMFGKKHTATWAVALVFVVISMLINVCLLVDEYAGGYLGVFINTYSELMTLLFQIVLLLVVLVSNSSIETTRNHRGA